VNFVHYALEPKRLSVNEYDGKYYTTMQLNGSVTTPEGRLVYQFDKAVSLNLGPDEMATANNKPFDIHDLFPSSPRYKVSILLKNEVSKEFTTVDATLRVPSAEGVVLSAPFSATTPSPRKRTGRCAPSRWAASRSPASRAGPSPGAKRWSWPASSSAER